MIQQGCQVSRGESAAEQSLRRRNSTNSSDSPFVTAVATGVQAAQAVMLGSLDRSLAATVMTQQQFRVGAAAAA